MPFKNLGDKLKASREKRHVSRTEVSEAVEIDPKLLKRIEDGAERPSEDILELLISYLGIKDETADDLWSQAGYDYCDNCGHYHDPEQENSEKSQPQSMQVNATVMVIPPVPVEQRIIYSDGVNVAANSSGVTLNFSQGSGTPQAQTFSKVGMSRDQAYGLMRLLHKTLEASRPKLLPYPAEKKDEKTS